MVITTKMSHRSYLLLFFHFTSLLLIHSSLVIADDSKDVMGGPPPPGDKLPPRAPPHEPLPPGKRFWIFDDFPLLMNWTLFYVGCGLTSFLWLTGYALRKWEDYVDRDDKMPNDDSNEEEAALIQDAAYHKSKSNHRGNGVYPPYGAVQQSTH